MLSWQAPEDARDGRSDVTDSLAWLGTPSHVVSKTASVYSARTQMHPVHPSLLSVVRCPANQAGQVR